MAEDDLGGFQAELTTHGAGCRVAELVGAPAVLARHSAANFSNRSFSALGIFLGMRRSSLGMPNAASQPRWIARLYASLV